MKLASLPAAAAMSLLAIGLVGCAGGKNKPAPEPSPTVTDISPMPPSQPPVVVQPAPVEPAGPAASKGAITTSRYTAQPGDTLYNIALRKYGRGSTDNIAKIQKANPGLTPENLKAGQTINLP